MEDSGMEQNGFLIEDNSIDLEELLMQHLKQHGLLEKWRSSFMETPEGRIFSQINTQERNRLEFYHFLRTGTFMEDEQDQ